MLEVLDHDLAGELGLALCADAERERYFRDGMRGNVGFYEQVERDFEAFCVEAACFEELVKI